MRFVMLTIPKGYENAAPRAMPDAKAVAAMMKYNESLQEGRRAVDARRLPPASDGRARLILGREAHSKPTGPSSKRRR
jgi:hypothetical protein